MPGMPSLTAAPGGPPQVLPNAPANEPGRLISCEHYLVTVNFAVAVSVIEPDVPVKVIV